MKKVTIFGSNGTVTEESWEKFNKKVAKKWLKPDGYNAYETRWYLTKHKKQGVEVITAILATGDEMYTFLHVPGVVVKGFDSFEEAGVSSISWEMGGEEGDEYE